MASNGSLLPASGKVLANGDLLYGIFTFLSLDFNRQDRHVAKCTYVCRVFHEPAVRVLWRHMSTLFPLWQLLVPQNLPTNFSCWTELDCMSQV